MNLALPCADDRCALSPQALAAVGELADASLKLREGVEVATLACRADGGADCSQRPLVVEAAAELQRFRDRHPEVPVPAVVDVPAVTVMVPVTAPTSVAEDIAMSPAAGPGSPASAAPTLHFGSDGGGTS